jgi:hypothetical protein
LYLSSSSSYSGGRQDQGLSIGSDIPQGYGTPKKYKTDEDRNRTLPDMTEQQGKGRESRDPHQEAPQH